MTRIYCKFCGAKLKRDHVGQLCPTRHCQWQHGVPKETVTRKPKQPKPVKCWRIKRRYRALCDPPGTWMIVENQIVAERFAKKHCLVVPGYFTPDEPKKKARKR